MTESGSLSLIRLCSFWSKISVMEEMLSETCRKSCWWLASIALTASSVFLVFSTEIFETCVLTLTTLSAMTALISSEATVYDAPEPLQRGDHALDVHLPPQLLRHPRLHHPRDRADVGVVPGEGVLQREVVVDLVPDRRDYRPGVTDFVTRAPTFGSFVAKIYKNISQRVKFLEREDSPRLLGRAGHFRLHKVASGEVRRRGHHAYPRPGSEGDFKEIAERSKATGAIKHYQVDAKEEFISNYVLPSIRANGMYEGKYPLATALGRPLIADEARRGGREGGRDRGGPRLHRQGQRPGQDGRDGQVAGPVAQGHRARTGVEHEPRPGAGLRQEARHQDQALELDIQHRPEPLGPVDRERSAGGPGHRAARQRLRVGHATRGRARTPPGYLELGFVEGIPRTVDGEEMGDLELIRHVNQFAGKHGVGIIDHIEDRLVGIKSREVYEAPAALTIIEAHRDLEQLVLTRHELAFKAGVEREWSWLVYSGLWMEPLRFALDSFVRTTQRRVTGHGQAQALQGRPQGRRSVVGELALQSQAVDLPEGLHVRPVVGGRVHRAVGASVEDSSQGGFGGHREKTMPNILRGNRVKRSSKRANDFISSIGFDSPITKHVVSINMAHMLALSRSKEVTPGRRRPPACSFPGRPSRRTLSSTAEPRTSIT